MWWQDAITVAVVCLAMVSVITAVAAAVLVLVPAMAGHCDGCGRAMIDSHLDGTPVCLHCRHAEHLLSGRLHHHRADRELTTASRGV
jgi:hypothetical protein